MPLRIQIENYRALRAVDATFDGVCLLVGPNGGGKTSLFNALRMLVNMGEHGTQRALDMDGGGGDFNHRGCDKDALTCFVAEIEWLKLKVEFKVRGVGYSVEPRYNMQAMLSDWMLKEFNDAGAGLNIKTNVWANILDAENQSFKEVAKSFFMVRPCFGDFNSFDVKRNGSHLQSSSMISSRGEDIFSVLRNWYSQKPQRYRYEFVLRWMREAFGERFVDMDFESAGQTVTMRYYAAGDEVPRPIHTASNGMVCMLFNLAVLASPVNRVGDNNKLLVCLDEPENGLHPHALRTFIAAAREWSAAHGTVVLLATHSPFLLNEFSQTPENVFVMDPSGEKQLWRLDEELNAEWLKQFMLGDLYGRDFARQGEEG